MRKRKRLLFLTAAIVVPLVGLGIWLSRPPKSGVTLDNFYRLSPGMKLEEVEAILGPHREQLHADVYVWLADDGPGMICIYGNPASMGYFRADRSQYPFESLRDTPEGVVDKIQRWLSPQPASPFHRPPPPPPLLPNVGVRVSPSTPPPPPPPPPTRP